MIRHEIVGDKEVVAHLMAFPPSLRTQLRAEVNKQSVDLWNHVKNTKLSGQVLRHVTGHLKDSLNVQVTETETGVHGQVGLLGKSVKYAAYHEYGFSGQRSIKECLRMQTMAWGRAMKPPRQVTVRAHTQNVNYLGRPFMRPSLAERAPLIQAGMTAVVERATKA